MSKSVSVVIASGAGGEFLFRCLTSVVAQAQQEQAEVIVVDRCGGVTEARIRQEFPQVILETPHLDHRPSVPELRRIGAERARGDVVAIIEEHCVAPPHWLKTIREQFRDADAAIGGPILDDNYPRIRDWVVYFSEYHNYMPPWADGPRWQLNGANIAYSRAKLMAHRDILDSGYWEVVLHPVLAGDGDFRAVSNLGVYHTGPFDFGYYLGQRYLLSRVWGGSQREQVSLGRRLVYLLAAPVFPFLLLARIASRVFQSGQHVGRFLLALPMLALVVMVYVWGEWCGYAFGYGDALERVE